MPWNRGCGALRAVEPHLRGNFAEAGKNAAARRRRRRTRTFPVRPAWKFLLAGVRFDGVPSIFTHRPIRAVSFKAITRASKRVDSLGQCAEQIKCRLILSHPWHNRPFLTDLFTKSGKISAFFAGKAIVRGCGPYFRQTGANRLLLNGQINQ